MQQKDTELRSAAASQREAGEALKRVGAKTQRLEQEVGQLQARNLELQRAQSAAEAQETNSLQNLRQQVFQSNLTFMPSSCAAFRDPVHSDAMSWLHIKALQCGMHDRRTCA